MTSRFLSFVALSGMLIAAGCSGGGAGSGAGSLSSGITPAGPSTGGSSSSRGGGAIMASFLIPNADLKASTSSSSRSAKYISPGSSGLTVLLGNGTPPSSGNGASGSAQLFQAVNGTNAANANTVVTVQLVPGSFNAAPVQGQALTFQDTTAAAPNNYYNCAGALVAVANACTFTITAAPQANGSSLTGLLTVAGVPTAYTGGANSIPAANTLVQFTNGSNAGQTPVIGTLTQPVALANAPTAPGICYPIPSTVYGAQSGSTACYYFTPSASSGYTQATVTLNNLKTTAVAGSGTYTVGIVLSDISNNKNFVLSENQVGNITVVASGQAVANVTLLPVVDGVVAAPPVLDQLTTVAGGAQPGSYETTLFLTDELGYVIPTSGPAAASADNAPTVANSTLLAVSPSVATSLTLGYWTAPAPALPATVTTLTAIPTNAFTAGGVATVTFGGAAGIFANNAVFGSYLPIDTPTATGIAGLVIDTGVGDNVATAGNPLNIVCDVATPGTATTAFKGVLTSAINNTVTGFLPVAGTNYPPATQTFTLGTVNCSPGIVTNVN